MKNFPIELRSKIFGIIANQMEFEDAGKSHRQALLACTTVCSDFNSLAIPALYSFVRLRDLKEDEDAENSPARKFLQRLENPKQGEAATLCAYVKSLHITLYENEHAGEAQVARVQSGLPRILYLLSSRGSGSKGLINFKLDCGTVSFQRPRAYSALSVEFEDALIDCLEDAIARKGTGRLLETLQIQYAEWVPGVILNLCTYATKSLSLVEIVPVDVLEHLTNYDSKLEPRKLRYEAVHDFEEYDIEHSIFHLPALRSLTDLEICLTITEASMEYVCDAISINTNLQRLSLTLKSSFWEEEDFMAYETEGDIFSGLELNPLQNLQELELVFELQLNGEDSTYFHTPIISLIRRMAHAAHLEYINLTIEFVVLNPLVIVEDLCLLFTPPDLWKELDHNLSNPERFPNFRQLNITIVLSLCKELYQAHKSFQIARLVRKNFKENLRQLQNRFNLGVSVKGRDS